MACLSKFSCTLMCLGAFLLAAAAPAQAATQSFCTGTYTTCNQASTDWCVRDDDGDGVCNGADVCPYEVNPPDAVTGKQDASKCAMQAITVPWIPGNPGYPHSTYSGATTTLMGMARNGGDQYYWDYGDGTPAMAWTAIGNAFNLSTTHVYTAEANRPFNATLYVRTAANPGVVASAQFPVIVQLSSDLSQSSQMDVRTNMAIDKGLWYLHTTGNAARNSSANGAPYYGEPYMNWESLQGTCAAVDALQLHGSKALGDYDKDPYVEDVRRGLNYIFTQASVYGIGNQNMTHSGNVNPDTNGNGVGIALGGDSTYINGICGVVIGSSGAPNKIATTGPNSTNGAGKATGTFGRPYKDIVQDIVDWFAYGQTDSGWAEGGWLYSSNSGAADSSTNQWPILTMAAAESMKTYGVSVPAFVRTEIPYFLNYAHHTQLDANVGGWGYRGSTSIGPNQAETAAGILAHFFLGDTVNQVDVQAGIGYFYNTWGGGAGAPDTCWNVGNGSSYAMYGAMKVMRTPSTNISRVTQFAATGQVPDGLGTTSDGYNGSMAGSQTANSFDWYYQPTGNANAKGPVTGLASNLTTRQQADGHWADTTGCHGLGATHTTAWDSIILAPAVTAIPPKACIVGCTASWDLNAPVSFDGSCSSDPDASHIIKAYDWDFNYNGKTFNATPEAGYSNAFPTIVYPTGYPAYTEDHNGNPVAGAPVYTAALRVSDNTSPTANGPLTNIATCNVNIKPPPHCPNITAGGPYLAKVNVAVPVDASASFDVDNDPLSYAWDFSNSGNFTVSSGNAACTALNCSTATSPSFATPGNYIIGVAGTDHPEGNSVPYSACPNGVCSSPFLPPNGDCTVKAYSTVQVGAHNPVSKPGGPYTSVPNKTIQLDGSASTDPDGLTLTYAWDLSGNGLFNDSTAAKPNFVVGNVAPGFSYTVCLKVSNGANTNTACSTVSVITQQVAPICSIVAPNVVASCNGGAEKINVDGSRSYDTNQNALTYTWSSNCNATIDNPAASVVNLNFNTFQQGCAQACTATLTVNNGYFTSSCNVNIDIVDNIAPAYTATPVNKTFECDANATANVNAWLAGASAQDKCGAAGTSVAMSNSFQPATGATLAQTCGGVGVGKTTSVTWSAQDVCSTTSIGQKTATVTVVDTTAPVLALPASVSQEATGPTTPVTFVTSATDYVSGTTAVSCAPASGSSFAVGATTVSCSSTDGAGNKAIGTFVVTVTDTTPPTLTLPAPIVAEATKPTGAVVTFTATARDLVSGISAVTCTPASGSTFAIGVTTVTCGSSDTRNNAGTGTFTVTVGDTTAPVVTVPSNILVEATMPAGAVVTFASTAADIVDGATAVTCTPASGSTFPVAATTVTCTSTDSHSNTGTNSFSVTVQDRTAPVFAGAPTSGSITEEATSAAGMTLADYALTASDIVDGATAVNCTPSLPNTFALGSNAVNCTSTDKAGNTAPIAFNVVVVDTTPPVLTCPGSVTVAANGPRGAENWGVDETTSNALKAFFAQASTTDLVDPMPSLTNDAPALFPSGQSTTVTFTSVDAHQNQSSCTTTVTVTYENVAAPALVCPGNITLAGGAEIDWTTAFRRPVSVELLVIGGSPSAGAVSVSELSKGAVQLTASPLASGSYAVRIRATDEVSGLAVECNRFVSAAAPAVAAAKPGSGTLATAVAQ